MPRHRALFVFLTILSLFLVGTFVVLSSFTYYLFIDPSAYLTDLEVPVLGKHERWNGSEHGLPERIPRIIHQTWKTEVLPPRWKNISEECREMMPDYEYMLWTDESSRDFIATHYDWFLDTFDNYQYAIQRADVIRYFVLHYYGGIYMDLDIGCTRPLDPLLSYPVILPKTIPVGVSNDLMFAEKGHSFLAQSIHNLVTFDHNWVLNYPTVMFSTGPMFLSAQYTIYTSSHASSPDTNVRILPRSLYGKNAPEGEAPNSFFTHFYGSSWHSDDAGFIGFLGTRGKVLLRIGVFMLLVGGIRMLMHATKHRRHSMRGYDVLFPRVSSRTGRWRLSHLPRLSMGSSSTTSSTPSSPDETGLSPNGLPVFHFDMRPGSPASSESSYTTDGNYPARPPSPFYDAYRRVRSRVSSAAGLHPDDAHRIAPRGRRQHRSRGVLFFLPAIFAPSQDIEMGASAASSSREPSMPVPRLPPGRGWFSPTKDLETGEQDLLIDATDVESSRPQGAASSAISARPAVGEEAQLIDFTGDDAVHPQQLPIPRPLVRSQSATGTFSRSS